jgi:tetratricopeptide (TPR) repeat protein
MFTNRTRLFIGAIFLLSLILLLNIRRYEFASVAFVMIVLLIWDYFKQGTLVIAAKHFYHKDYEKTENVLLQIKKPTWLGKKRRGYYEFFMGGICLQKQDFEDAERHYEIAAQYPLRSVNDHVAALVHVANICIRQRNYEKAEAYLQLSDQHKEKINAKMKDVIERLRQELQKHK